MNEPQSIAAEILALSILAGEDAQGNPLVRPRDFIPFSIASSTLWPVAPFSSLIGTYTIPAGHIWMWTHVSLYATLANETSLAVNFGFNFDTYCFIQVQTGTDASSAFQTITGSILSQTLFNHPLLLIFQPDTIPRIILNPSGSSQSSGSVRVEAYFHGYLLPAGLSSAFKPFTTRLQ